MSETGARRASRATALPVLHLQLDSRYDMVRHGSLRGLLQPRPKVPSHDRGEAGGIASFPRGLLTSPCGLVSLHPPIAIDGHFATLP